jgi:hypothetical protein
MANGTLDERLNENELVKTGIVKEQNISNHQAPKDVPKEKDFEIEIN